ncbi:MAG: RagB/SusD family nutrient uptake outer membrane protein [Chitinophagaceae bacterium]|jgi:tetratricopeptide (TPR) repeat protein
MKNIFLKLSLIALVVTSFSACRDALVIDPRQSIDAATALNTKDGINAAVVSVYSRFKSVRLYGRDLIAIPEALADNGFATNKSGRLLPEANNVFRAHFTGTHWSACYNGINQANLILEAIPTSTAPGVTAADKASWTAQLQYLRALYYFDLVKVYSYMPGATVPAQDKGGIPIVLKGISTSAGAIELLPSRAPIADVYAQVVADLIAAEAALPNSTNANFANKAAAQALLSRVYLYMKDYAKAKEWADKCITLVGPSRLSNAGSYVAQWRNATHQETLFQFALASNAENNGVNESLQTSFTTLTAPGGALLATGGFGDLVPTISLMNALGITLTGGNTTTTFGLNASIASRSSDVRNLLYEPGTTGRGASKVECTKYIGKNGFINLDNLPVIRIAEVYLTRAEAMTTPGSPVFNETAALADLNTIATNRGLTAFTLSGSALYEEILNQRRLELAFEGHRFFDLKRLGRDLVKAPHYLTVAFTDIRILAPLPTSEIDGNKNMVQNAGY